MHLDLMFFLPINYLVALLSLFSICLDNND
jgi:hypothetical protein